MTTPTTKHSARITSNLLTLKELASFLRKSACWVYHNREYLATKGVNTYRIGGEFRFDLREVEKMVRMSCEN